MLIILLSIILLVAIAKTKGKSCLFNVNKIIMKPKPTT